ncbi:hypothetical protein HYV50_03150 [Candidatus Pacearchaeota archaeon]|nr:hypothetical protein [Candidatus Pacearchaeota archaeon]
MLNIKNLVLGIGIVIVFALALWQGIEAFYPSPQYEDFCQGREFYDAPSPNGAPLINQTACEQRSGKWINNYCDYNFYCQKDLDAAKDQYAKIVFIVSLIVGIIALIAGYGVLSVEPVGSALIGSGIWAIFWGSAINWRNFSNIWRFSLLFLALVLLIYLALRLNKRVKKIRK